jgi:CheY-like chemotaxis protein
MDRILVVDDEPDILNLTRMILEKEGYWVTSATNGVEALKMLESQGSDLVLLDLVMPGKSGLEVCEIIKSQPKTKNIPVIMFTALGREVDKRLSRQAGAEAHFTKPFTKEDLLQEVKHHITEARTSGFSRRLGIEIGKLRGRKMLLEIDPRSAYEKIVVDFAIEFGSNEEAVLVVTHQGSAVMHGVKDYKNVKLLVLDPRAVFSFSPLLSNYPDGRVSLVFDSLTDAALMVGVGEAQQRWLYQFTQNSLRVLDDDRITALFLLNAEAHDPKGVASVRGLFNHQITYTAEGAAVMRQV